MAVRAVAAKVVQQVAARDAKMKIRLVLEPVGKVKEAKGKTAKAVKGTINKKAVSKWPVDVPVPAGPAKRGRPKLSGCNGCRRLLMGKVSLGNGHTCGKVKWARM